MEASLAKGITGEFGVTRHGRLIRMDARQRFNELVPVQAVMTNFYSQLIRQGIQAQYVPATEMTLMTYINIGQGQGGAVMANFLVHWNEDTQVWSVHRLSYQRVQNGLLRVEAPEDIFPTPPDRRWFTSALQAWLDHELREGIFAPPLT